eukprot:scaffold164758_cov46-Prasinocladus_malaysianus.AAC.2
MATSTVLVDYADCGRCDKHLQQQASSTNKDCGIFSCQHLQTAGVTAFRSAEKRYQLKREQMYRNRNGKRYGAGLRTQPTDFSGVLDLRLLSDCKGPVERRERSYSDNDIPPSTQTSIQYADQFGIQKQRTNCGKSIFSFQKYPGLYVLTQA